MELNEETKNELMSEWLASLFLHFKGMLHVDIRAAEDNAERAGQASALIEEVTKIAQVIPPYFTINLSPSQVQFFGPDNKAQLCDFKDMAAEIKELGYTLEDPEEVRIWSSGMEIRFYFKLKRKVLTNDYNPNYTYLVTITSGIPQDCEIEYEEVMVPQKKIKGIKCKGENNAQEIQNHTNL